MTTRLSVDSDQGKHHGLVVDVAVLDLGRRLRKTARVTGPILLIGIVGIFVPILHFVIVPAALIAALVLGIREFTTHRSYLVQTLNCPQCQASFGESEIVRLPLRLTCFSCRVTSTISEDLT